MNAPIDRAFALKHLVGLGYVQCSGTSCRITAQGIEHFERELQ